MMPTKPRLILASCSVAIIAAVVGTTAALGPDGSRPWSLVCGALAVVVAVQSVASDSRELTVALLLSLAPLITLLAEGAPTWLLGPLGALLLLAGELNALSWECQGRRALGVVGRRRLLNTGRLAALGLVASVAVGSITPRLWAGGTAAFALAVAGLAGLGWLVFDRLG